VSERDVDIAAGIVRDGSTARAIGWISALESTSIAVETAVRKAALANLVADAGRHKSAGAPTVVPSWCALPRTVTPESV